jgi:hypothetical protein
MQKELRIEVIDREYAAILAAKTPAERAEMIANCHRMARVVLSAGERTRHPDWTEDQIDRAVAQRLLNGAI